MMQPEDKIQEIAERAERLQEIGSSILRAARDELYLGMRFLDVALSSFSYQMDGQVHGFGTDGRVMYFQPQMLGGLYRENRILVNRGYLHMVFHCISGILHGAVQKVRRGQTMESQSRNVCVI